MASEFVYQLRVPKDRIAVIIGTDGQTKRELERQTKTDLTIDSQEGMVSIEGNDAITLYTAREIIRAISRGFNPDIAKLLLRQDYGLEIVPINEYAKTQNDLIRLKGRVIGEEGKGRRTIEELTGCTISVYGKTVGIIAEFDALTNARRAIESLLSGSTHASVYKWLEQRRREMRQKQAAERF